MLQIVGLHKIFNIGNSKPENLSNYISAIEKHLNRKKKLILVEMQPGDVEATYANNESLENWIGYKPSTTIDEGIKNFIDWYLDYYKKRKLINCIKINFQRLITVMLE